MNRYADILYAACSILGLAGICMIAAGLYLRSRTTGREPEERYAKPEDTGKKPLPPAPAVEPPPPEPPAEQEEAPTTSFVPAQLLDSVDVSETAIAPKARKPPEEEVMAELPPFPAPPPLPDPPPTTSGFFPLGQALEEEEKESVGEDDATVLVQRSPPKRA